MHRLFPIILLISLLSASLPLTTTAQDGDVPTNDAPYLYYYSIEYQAFVIEQVDGTNRHLLGDGLIPDDHNFVYEAGWSPSGDWFAWISTLANPFPNFNPNQAYIVSADNQTHPTVLNEFSNIAQMKWFPTQDLLVVIDFPNELNMQDAFEPDSSIRIALIDPAQNIIINEYRTPVASYAGKGQPMLSPEIFHTADDEIMVVPLKTFEINAEKEYLFEDIILLIHKAEEIEFKRYPSDESTQTQILRLNDISTTYTIHQFNQTYYINELLGDSQITFTGDAVKHFIPLVNGYLLIKTRLFCENQPTNCPPQIKILRMDNLQELPLFGEETDNARGYVYPSPNGEYLLFRDEDSQFQLLTLETAELIDIPLGDIEPRQADSSDEYWLDNRYFSIANGQYIDNRVKVLLFDVQQKTNQIMHLYGTSGSVFLSPDQSHMAYYRGGNDIGTVIHQIETDTLIHIRPDSRSYLSNPDGEVYWHPSGEWLLLAEDTLVAGGGVPRSRWIGVVKQDGTMRREVDWCWATKICYGWLPPQVSLDTLPIIQIDSLPTPANTLYGKKWISYLSWSPDGQYLAVDYEFGNLWLWDIANNEVLEMYPSLNHRSTDRPINYLPQIEWMLDESGQYYPQTIPPLEIEGWTDARDFVYAISPDKKQIVGATQETTGIFDRTTKTLIYPIEYLGSFANYSPDGKYLVMGGWFASTEIYDTQTWQVVTTVRSEAVYNAAFSPDGQYLAVGSSWDVQIWDVATLLGE